MFFKDGFVENIMESDWSTSSSSSGSCNTSAGSDTSDSSESSDDEEELFSRSRHDSGRIKNYVEEVVEEYSDKEFRSHFRVSHDSFALIKSMVANVFDQHNNAGREHVTVHQGVLILLWYLANQETFRQISDRFNVTRSTANGIINMLVDNLVKKSEEHIKWPKNNSYQKISEEFFNRKRLPGVIAAIDGSHIPIVRPHENQSDYCNRKSYHSLILQGVVDHRKVFMDVYCGEPGSIHDARVLRRSGIFAKSKEDDAFFGDYYILGDSAYPCLPWLVSPFRDNGHLSTEQKHFNYVHSSTRMVVENAFGLLKGRFRRLRKFDNINIPFIVKAIVVACMLHNICILFDDLGVDFEEVDDGLDVNFLPLRDLSPIGINKRQAVFNSVLKGKTTFRREPTK